MKFLLVPDSFKGSLSSEEFCDIAEKTIKKHIPDAQVLSYPISDGGENSVECLINLLGGKLLSCKVTDSNFFKKTVKYGVTDNSAIIAVASSAGLAETLIKNPLYTTTYGVGEQIKLAKTLGKKHIYLCLGGSSTNDGGAGMVCALGARFYDKEDNEFIPTGINLGKIARIELSQFYKNIEGLEFTALCDVKNPLLGENGCSRIYARQKGASDDDIEFLEENMAKFASVTSHLCSDSSFEGSGSAGGMGYAVKTFLDGKIYSGIQFFLDCMNFETKANTSDYIITGEGCFDRTSIMGKVCAGVMARSSQSNAKLVIICGKNALDYMPENIYKIIETSEKNYSLEENMSRTKELLSKKLSSFLSDEIKKM